jgi:gp32 DNA binding protein like
MSFKDMKSRSKSPTSYQSLSAEMEKLNKRSESYKDDRLWKPELDKASNGYAVMRFLPAAEGEDLPWARTWTHGFRGTGGWYIENSLTTIGLKDPVSEMNTLLWNSGSDDDKKIARDRKRRLSYISNVYVVSDPKNPNNEGKVFLFRYGKKIFEKIQEVMNPQYQDEKAINPFDFWAGADFKLKIRQVDGYVNYDRSEFATPAPLLGGDDKALEELWKRQYALKEFTDPKNFKSYDELKARLHEVLGSDIRASVTESAAKGGAESASFDDDSPRAGRKPAMADAPAPKREAKQKVESNDTEDALSYFEKLAGDE